MVLPRGAVRRADYPGHYMRRIKRREPEHPCVAGPLTSINCTLTLLSSTTRIKSALGDSYAVEDDDDDRFASNFAAIQHRSPPATPRTTAACSS